MIVYVDVDETICCYEGERDYPSAKPIEKHIGMINKLYDLGHHIVYWTARGANSGIDWTELTKEQLVSWGAKHHGVLLGKPHYDLYIDDKSINCESFFHSIGKILE
jgi:hypothetical protein